MLRRSVRRREGLTLVEGPRPLAEAVAAGAAVEDLFVIEDAPDDVRAAVEQAGREPLWVSEPVLKAMTDTVTPQGVVALVAVPQDEARSAIQKARLILVLHEVQDPGNAGTLVRSAAAADADLVVMTTGSVDAFAPKTIRSSAGAVFRVPVLTDIALDDVLEMAHAAGVRTIGADASVDSPVWQADLVSPTAIVLGNEAHGLNDDLTSALDDLVSIPMPGGVESLNVAVAGSLLLFEAVRQRSRDGAETLGSQP